MNAHDVLYTQTQKTQIQLFILQRNKYHDHPFFPFSDGLAMRTKLVYKNIFTF